ncbi:hypothetical protein ACIG47_09385 [Promicromonospora sp. NPDC052451]|uniref:hypothetical protein n=1 Tax=unclassified Promicromonospora TaxID=2647929 RepID=UPI0037C7946A
MTSRARHRRHLVAVPEPLQDDTAIRRARAMAAALDAEVHPALGPSTTLGGDGLAVSLLDAGRARLVVVIERLPGEPARWAYTVAGFAADGAATGHDVTESHEDALRTARDVLAAPG